MQKTQRSITFVVVATCLELMLLEDDVTTAYCRHRTGPGGEFTRLPARKKSEEVEGHISRRMSLLLRTDKTLLALKAALREARRTRWRKASRRRRRREARILGGHSSQLTPPHRSSSPLNGSSRSRSEFTDFGRKMLRSNFRAELSETVEGGRREAFGHMWQLCAVGSNRENDRRLLCREAAVSLGRSLDTEGRLRKFDRPLKKNFCRIEIRSFSHLRRNDYFAASYSVSSALLQGLSVSETQI